jgi:hypothetical protein
MIETWHSTKSSPAPGSTTGAALMANRSLAQLGIPATKVQQIDLIRLTRKGRTLVRSWVGPGPTDPGSAGDREPRNPLPNPPHLKAERDLPRS